MKGIIKFGSFRIPLSRFVSAEPHEDHIRIYYLRCDSQVKYVQLFKKNGYSISDVDKALAEAISEDAEKLLKMRKALQVAEETFKHIQRLVELVRKYRNWDTAAYTMKEYYGCINKSAEDGTRSIRRVI